MMVFEEKKKKAIDLMENKKMWRSNYAPPILRLFWKMGSKMPPPPFAPFWLNTMFFAAWYSPIWGIFMWFTIWKNQGFSVLHAVFIALFSGLLFGLFMALFHYWRKRSNKLPDWKSL